MHPLNSAETAVVVDAIHSNLQPDEYIKHEDSPYCLMEEIGYERIYHAEVNGRYRTKFNNFNYMWINFSTSAWNPVLEWVKSELVTWREYNNK